ncbi:MAG TPA: potassium transporter TrkA [Candidatus Methanoperedenaceae archaeon]|nr:potassium transporter TrkA [Candidatus Methanoperedenaceae archaeon]
MGRIGLAVARELESRGKTSVLFDRDAKKVETLKEQNFEALVGDIGDTAILEYLKPLDLCAVFILSSDIEANRKALSYIKQAAPKAQTVVRAASTADKETLESAGSDLVILPSRLEIKSVAGAVVKHVESALSRNKLQELLRIMGSSSSEKLAIVVHDNPDPDAISSAMALKEIAGSRGVKADILYRGNIGHHENKAFVNLLDIDITKTKNYSVSDYKRTALVDCAVPGVNNLLPPNAKVSIVIDHHQVTEVNADYVDIRPNVGATASIMAKYIADLEIPLRNELATALFYGIRVDTADFSRNVDIIDMNSAAFLFPYVDRNTLKKIEAPAMSTETLDILGEAIKKRRITGSYLISNVGYIHDRDALAHAADYLLNLEGIATTIVFGLAENNIYLSARSKDVRVNVGRIVAEAFGEAYGGGHPTFAGAQIPLGVFATAKDKETLMRLADEAVSKRFAAVLGIEKETI